MCCSSLLLIWLSESDHIVNSKNGDGSLSSKFKTLDLRHGWFNDTVFQVITDLSVHKLESGIFKNTPLFIVASSDLL